MDDLISRQAAIDYFVTNVGFHDEDGDPIDDSDELRKIWTEYFDGIPSAQPERKRGKWIEANTHIYEIYECTACKAWTYIPNGPRDYNFCPRCGADMREVDDERPD